MNLYYKGPQPHVFTVGREVEKDKVGNIRVKSQGREITLIPAKHLPGNGQMQPVDSADWKRIVEHPIYGPVVKDMKAQGDLVEYPG